MAGIQNTIIFSAGERLTPSSAGDISQMQAVSTDVAKINYTGNPEGAVAANPGSTSHDPVSGNVYFKQTGTGNTGWKTMAPSTTTLVADDTNSLTANSFNVYGQKAGTIPVVDSLIAGGNFLVEDRTWITPLVVDPSATAGLRGTYQTIAAALTAAVSGQDIIIRAGSYTENPSLKAGVNLVGMTGDGDTPQVTIIGNCAASFAGVCSISNIRLQTNSAAFLTGSGSAGTTVNLIACVLNCTNATGIAYSGSAGNINAFRCRWNLGTTGIAYWSSTSSGGIICRYCFLENSGNSTTVSTHSNGEVDLFYCRVLAPIAATSSGVIVSEYTEISCQGLNVTAVTTSGTSLFYSYFGSIWGGSASAASFGSGTIGRLFSTIIASSNTNAITGAGEVRLNYASFIDVSQTINTTTQTPFVVRPGIVRNNYQPAFYAYLPSSLSNATGDGTTVTLGGGTALTEVFDQNNNFVTSGTFTAPYTGVYSFVVNVQISGITASHTTGLIKIVATGTTYTLYDGGPGKYADNANVMTYNSTATIAMTAGDTCTFTIQLSGGTKVATIVGGNGNTFVSAFMLG